MGHNLSDRGLKAMQNFVENTARVYNAKPNQTFAATPTVAQTLNDKIVTDGNPFLSKINVIGVQEIKGEKVLMGLSGRVSSRTNTAGAGERVAKNLLSLGSKGFELFKTDSDTAIRYAQIDMWAKFSDFAERYNKQVRIAIGNDRLTCGWHGIEAAEDTDIATNPNLEDLNVGWLQLLREYNSGSQVLAATVEDPIALGSTDFPNLDILVHETKQMLHESVRSTPGLTAFISEDLLMAAQGDYYESQGATPSEKEKLRNSLVMQTYGGLPAEVPPFFPAGTILVTTHANLSIYWQEGSWRRKIDDNSKKDQYDNWNSRNEGYVVEEELLAGVTEGITIAAA